MTRVANWNGNYIQAKNLIRTLDALLLKKYFSERLDLSGKQFKFQPHSVKRELNSAQADISRNFSVSLDFFSCQKIILPYESVGFVTKLTFLVHNGFDS